jgi:hypothetical protein
VRRDAVRQHLPRLYFAARSLYRLIRGERLDPTSAAIVEHLCGSDPRVLWGPFAGTRYLRFASGSGLLPKLLGAYEMELHGAVRESLARGYDRILNIGCGEGYYAVGYARALPGASVRAWDSDPLARHRLRALARLNGVADRIAIGGTCSPRDLAAGIAGRTLVVCDCEGCEKELLDPAAVPGLVFADLLVEMHDFVDPAISSALLERFRASHDVRVVDAAGRSAFPAEILASLNGEQRRLALWEGRPEGMQWAWMTSRAR